MVFQCITNMITDQVAAMHRNVARVRARRTHGVEGEEALGRDVNITDESSVQWQHSC